MDNCKPIDLEEYRNIICLDEQFDVRGSISEKLSERLLLVEDLLVILQHEIESNTKSVDVRSKKSSYEEKRDLLYNLLTVRPPNPLPSWFNTKLDWLLLIEKKDRKFTLAEELTPIREQFPETSYGAANLCSLWKGDITTLHIDAIVNAANSALLGCFTPHHRCIDNAIHSAAGPRVREDCHKIMQKQGCYEGTGWAKITRGYNLPSNYILHTVGPVHKRNQTEVSYKEEKELASCYISCLDLGAQMDDIRSIALCSISTGIFGFPIKIAAKIAVETVSEWISSNPDTFDLVVFNVFSDQDYQIYKNLLIR